MYALLLHLLLLFRCCVVCEISSVKFHAVYNDGNKPELLFCAKQCAKTHNCVGFDVNSENCEMLTDHNVLSFESGHWVFTSDERLAQITTTQQPTTQQPTTVSAMLMYRISIS